MTWEKSGQDWVLKARTGELVGTAWAIPGGCWEGHLEPDFGGNLAAATALEPLQRWMEAEALRPHR